MTNLIKLNCKKWDIWFSTQNVNFYAKHVIANLPKLTVSAQNQTTKGLLKIYNLKVDA